MLSPNLIRLYSKCSPNLVRNFSTSCRKLSGATAWVYRTPPKPAPPHIVRQAELVGAVMWYWVIYHCLTQYEHITGEFTYPDPSKWTNEELGIPPDDED